MSTDTERPERVRTSGWRKRSWDDGWGGHGHTCSPTDANHYLHRVEVERMPHPDGLRWSVTPFLRADGPIFHTNDVAPEGVQHWDREADAIDAAFLLIVGEHRRAEMHENRTGSSWERAAMSPADLVAASYVQWVNHQWMQVPIGFTGTVRPDRITIHSTRVDAEAEAERLLGPDMRRGLPLPPATGVTA